MWEEALQVWSNVKMVADPEPFETQESETGLGRH